MVEEVKSSSKMAAYAELAKIRLNITVVISAVAGYFLADAAFIWSDFLYLVLGGFLTVGASNGFNQVIERQQDAIMDRTKDRPLPSGRLTVMEAMIACTIMGLVGLGMLYMINPLSAVFGALSLFIYVAIYTPLKQVSPIAVFVGAIPGAIPFMLGWVAATNDFDIEPGILFAIQFLWQFPHFWAIAWLLDDDYKKAGYKLLPTGKKDKRTAAMTLSYSIYMVCVAALPFFGFTGSLSWSLAGFIASLILGAIVLRAAYRLLKLQDHRSAKKLLYATLIYLPALQLIMVLDKYI
jgi:protoheme IX farnesyltransferase